MSYLHFHEKNVSNYSLPRFKFFREVISKVPNKQSCTTIILMMVAFRWMLGFQFDSLRCTWTSKAQQSLTVLQLGSAVHFYLTILVTTVNRFLFLMEKSSILDSKKFIRRVFGTWPSGGQFNAGLYHFIFRDYCWTFLGQKQNLSQKWNLPSMITFFKVITASLLCLAKYRILQKYKNVIRRAIIVLQGHNCLSKLERRKIRNTMSQIFLIPLKLTASFTLAKFETIYKLFRLFYVSSKANTSPFWH